MKKNEIAYYPEITRFIESQLQSNFRAEKINDIYIFWKNGELTSGLKALILEHPIECSCLTQYSEITPPLNLDIFGVVTNGVKFEIVILEIKLKTAVGLSEWSQLAGYNLVSGAKYGLLINIDAGASDRLTRILSFDEDVSRILRRRKNGTITEHLLGFIQWNSVTQNFEYSNLGQISSLSLLSKILIAQFC